MTDLLVCRQRSWTFLFIFFKETPINFRQAFKILHLFIQLALKKTTDDLVHRKLKLSFFYI